MGYLYYSTLLQHVWGLLVNRFELSVCDNSVAPHELRRSTYWQGMKNTTKSSNSTFDLTLPLVYRKHWSTLSHCNYWWQRFEVRARRGLYYRTWLKFPFIIEEDITTVLREVRIRVLLELSTVRYGHRYSMFCQSCVWSIYSCVFQPAK